MDKKARQILFKTYWTANGWIRKENRQTAATDFAYAKAKGVMLDPIVMSARQLKMKCRALVDTTQRRKLTDAFLASLTNSRIDLRSTMASQANLLTLLNSKRSSEYFYDVDEDDDVNALNFERVKWGGVRHGQPLYNYIDLLLFQNEVIAEPTRDDIALFNNILLTIRNAQPSDTASMLRDALKDVWPVSRNERGILLELLGCCGILEALDDDRSEPGRHDWNFVTYWRGEDRYNTEVLNRYFGHYGIIG